MGGPDHERFPSDLEGIAARLREQRVDPDPIALDQLKQRALAQFNAYNGRRTFMRSRLATIMAGLALVAGAGGAVAIAQAGNPANPHGGAADTQYKPGKGCGDTNHTHTGPPGNPSNTSCPH